ncbi:DUF899 family protein [Georgenia sp. Z1491]|uniref:DUF899 family protein n=1 Tax=Georgenia sp. Z1491 TaxID=3416707 RepID=UPI003CF56EE1
MDLADSAVDRTAWERAQAEHLVAEKAHTRAGDALAAARRRLPVTRVGPVRLVGAEGEGSLARAFEGRRQLVTYSFMWHHGEPLHRQCEGCTFSMSQVSEATRAYLAERDVTFAVLSEGAWPELAAYRDFMGWTMPWYSVELALDDPAVAGGGQLRTFVRDGAVVYLAWQTIARGTELLDMANLVLDRTLLGRQEKWEDSPDGWPQTPAGTWWRRDGRPVAQWLRTDAPVPGPATDRAARTQPPRREPHAPHDLTKEPS